MVITIPLENNDDVCRVGILLLINVDREQKVIKIWNMKLSFRIKINS